MGIIKDNLVIALSNPNISSNLTVKRITDGYIDYSGTPDTNENYGNYIGETNESLNILMSIQFISNNDSKNGNYVEYEKRGYTIKGSLKIKALNQLKEKDIIYHPNNMLYEVMEVEDRYYPDGNGDYEYVYTNAFAIKKEL